MTKVWTDNPNGLDTNLRAINTPDIGTAENPLGTVYAENFVGGSSSNTPNLLGQATIDLNSATVETITVNSSFYMLFGGNNPAVYMTDPSVLLNNAFLKIYTDVGLTDLFADVDLSGAIYGPAPDIDFAVFPITSPFRKNTFTTLYVDKDVLEGSAATVRILIIGANLA